MLKIDNLSKQVKGKQILKNLTLSIAKGQIAIFLGPSGVGKSTLLRVLNHLESYDEGVLHFEDKPLLKESVGMVFQHFNLFEHLTVEENITLPLIKCKKKEKKAALHEAQVLLKRYGLLEKAQESIQKLSGGQKQRLAIARTLALNPQIVCLDEPTSALDPHLTSQIAHTIAELANENRIVMLTTHDRHLVDYLKGQLFLMEAGTIAETGCKDACLANPGLFPKLHEFLIPR